MWTQAKSDGQRGPDADRQEARPPAKGALAMHKIVTPTVPTRKSIPLGQSFIARCPSCGRTILVAGDLPGARGRAAAVDYVSPVCRAWWRR